jgi:hypothetical protein
VVLAATAESGSTIWGKAICLITLSRRRTDSVAELMAIVNHLQGRMAANRKRGKFACGRLSTTPTKK